MMETFAHTDEKFHLSVSFRLLNVSHERENVCVSRHAYKTAGASRASVRGISQAGGGPTRDGPRSSANFGTLSVPLTQSELSHNRVPFLILCFK